MYCSNCGNPLEVTDNYCGNCGAQRSTQAPQNQNQGSDRSNETNGALKAETERVEPWLTFFTMQLKFGGRANRAEYWVGLAAYTAVYALVSVFIASVFELVAPEAMWFFDMVDLVAFLYLLFLQINVVIRRLHDLSNSGWWILLLLVPFLNFALFIYWGAKPAAPSNEYGEPRQSLD
jgi:uncharacterized membrane protein YhaH (DUF805 family)